MWSASFSRFGRNLLYGFRRKLRPYEAAVLEHVLTASTPSDQAALRLQLVSRERVQRWSDRMLYFGLPPGRNLPTIAASASDYCYAKVKLASSAGGVVAKVMTHGGVLSTIEFSKSPARSLSGDFKVQDVSLHPGGSGYATEIDAREHSQPTDT